MNQYLLIDNSNTWTKYCFASPAKLSGIHRIETAKLAHSFLKNLKRKNPKASVIVSSVVPDKAKLIEQIWKPYQYRFVSHRIPLGIKIQYPNPSTIGGDRLANAVSVIHDYKLPAVVIDFGTAVTFDIISKDKAYLGGIIAPGLNAMTNYLHEKTALLPKLTLKAPKQIVGKSTVEAMRVGTFVGYRGLIKEILKEIKKELRSNTFSVIATGGQAEALAQQITQIQKVDPALTLNGLRYIANLNLTS
ncbi:MAG: type III pantothenate kinase [Verrucomicrobiota bacterium]